MQMQIRRDGVCKQWCGNGSVAQRTSFAKTLKLWYSFFKNPREMLSLKMSKPLVSNGLPPSWTVALEVCDICHRSAYAISAKQISVIVVDLVHIMFPFAKHRQQQRAEWFYSLLSVKRMHVYSNISSIVFIGVYSQETVDRIEICIHY